MKIKIIKLQIRSAYRKKALQIHPDKNKDNPKAKELFEQLTDALKILTDPESKVSNFLSTKKKT